MRGVIWLAISQAHWDVRTWEHLLLAVVAVHRCCQIALRFMNGRNKLIEKQPPKTLQDTPRRSKTRHAAMQRFGESILHIYKHFGHPPNQACQPIRL
jgi:hypothetical protein